MKQINVPLTVREMEEILNVIDQSEIRNRILEDITMKLDNILDEIKYKEDL